MRILRFIFCNTAELSGYHSGEVSLQGTIVGMAQNFVGSNNIELLKPNGQFGTRYKGGKDAASARYIFTELSDITKLIYDERDLPLLDYLDDDGFPIEPKYYAPVIPMVLVNGADGIGTGFSTQVPCYNPFDIIANLKRMIDGEEAIPMNPWYRGFKGSIFENESSYTTKGQFNVQRDTVEITELPIGRWTEDYKEFIESLIDDNDGAKTSRKKGSSGLLSYENASTDTECNFMLKFSLAAGQKIDSNPDQFESDMRLSTSINKKNMHLYSPLGVINKFETTSEILSSYFDVRLNLYHKRRQHLLDVLRRELSLLENKERFISEIIEDTLNVYRKTRKEIDILLTDRDYLAIALDNGEPNFSYLTSMQISSFTAEKIETLQGSIKKTKAEISAIENTSAQDMWKSDLEAVSEKYRSILDEYLSCQSLTTTDSKSSSRKAVALGHKKKSTIVQKRRKIDV